MTRRSLDSTTARRAIGVLIALVLMAALLALGAQPTGASTPESVVGAEARISARRDIGSARVLLTVSRGDLRVVIAYHESKGWFAASADSVPRTVETSWTATRGGGPVPALSAAYGRASPGRVRVTWDDHTSDTVPVGSDGLWLAARSGNAHIARVERLAPDGAVTAQEEGL